MKRLNITLLIALLLNSFIYCQEDLAFVFSKSPSAIDISGIEESEINDHPLGINVAKKLKKFTDVYTYIEEGTPTQPVARTVVLKPSIYNSVFKVNRYYKKELKKGTLDIDEVTITFNDILNKGLYLYSEDTEEFEKYLQKQKKPEDIIKAFELIKFE